MRFEPPCRKSIKPFTNHTNMDLTKMDVNMQSVFLNHKNSLLQSAVKSGDYNLAHFLLEQCKADPNTIYNYGFTPLCEASRNGYIAIIELLFRYGAQINQVSLTLDKNLQKDVTCIDPDSDIQKMTPLHCAVKYGQLETVKVLISHGASVNVQSDHAGHTSPLISAVENNAYEMVELLIKNGADINAKDDVEELTALHHAVENKAYEIVELLLKNGAEVNTKDDVEKRIDLQYVVENQDTRMKELLTKHGANIMILDYEDDDDENFEDDDEYQGRHTRFSFPGAKFEFTK